MPKYQIVESKSGAVVFDSDDPQAIADESARLMNIIRVNDLDIPPPYTIKGLDSVTLPDVSTT